MFSRLEEFRFARWVKSLNRTAQIILSLTLVAALNYVAATHFHRWDLTATRRFSLSPETMSFLKQISKEPGSPPVTISLILPDDPSDEHNRLPIQQIRQLLKEYEYAASHLEEGAVPLKIEELSVMTQGTKIGELTKLGYLPTTQVMVVYGGRGHPLTRADFFDTRRVKQGTEEGETATAFNGENAISAAILDVIQTKRQTVYFTFGHNELKADGMDALSGLSNFALFLHTHNYNLVQVNLASANQVPDDASLLIIASPTLPFLPTEVEKLNRYLNEKNGSVMLFLAPGEQTGLDAVLTKWGLRSPDWLVVERDPNHLVGEGKYTISPGQDSKHRHELTRLLAMANLDVLLGPSRPVEIDQTVASDDRLQIHELLFTSNKSQAYKNFETDKPEPVSPILEPISVAALSERKASDAVDLPGGKLLVFGNANIIANQNFGLMGNPHLILNCVKYLAGHEYHLNIPPKLPAQLELNIAEAQYTGLAWRLAVLPGLVAILGFGVFWVRHRS